MKRTLARPLRRALRAIDLPRRHGLRRAAPRLYARLVRFAHAHARDVDAAFAQACEPVRGRLETARSLCLVDCGANEGFVLGRMLRALSPARTVAYEMQGALIPELRRRFPEVDVRHAAVSDREGRAAFTVNTRFVMHYRDGASLLNLDRDDRAPGEETALVDFAAVLRDLRARHDVILVKMDIEGAEYDVLDHLLDQPDGPLFDHLMVEFHARFVGPERHGGLLARLKASGLSFVEWH